MRFHLLDEIESADATRLVAVKQVSLAEEYLADHFPTFPVLPGVLMLEAATQAAAWLLWTATDFSRSMAVLKEARNVKYGRFVAPGERLRMTVEKLKQTDGGATFKATGTVNDATAVAARIELAYFDLADRSPGGAAALAATDLKLKAHHRRRWQVLTARGGPDGPAVAL